MVNHPQDYRWSSYSYNALGEPNPILTPHYLYVALGNNDYVRKQHYQALFKNALSTKEQGAIRIASQFNQPLGTQRFKQQIDMAIEKSLGLISRESPSASQLTKPTN